MRGLPLGEKIGEVILWIFDRIKKKDWRVIAGLFLFIVISYIFF